MFRNIWRGWLAKSRQNVSPEHVMISYEWVCHCVSISARFCGCVCQSLRLCVSIIQKILLIHRMSIRQFTCNLTSASFQKSITIILYISLQSSLLVISGAFGFLQLMIKKVVDIQFLRVHKHVRGRGSYKSGDHLCYNSVAMVHSYMSLWQSLSICSLFELS